MRTHAQSPRLVRAPYGLTITAGRRSLLLLAGAVSLSGCATTSPAKPTQPRNTAGQIQGGPSPAALELEAAVEGLDASSPEATRTRALSALVSVVPVLPGRSGLAEQMHAALAAHGAAPDPSARGQALDRLLVSARRMFESDLPGRASSSNYDAAVALFSVAVDALAAAPAPDRERAPLVRALRAATNVVFVAQGQTRPYDPRSLLVNDERDAPGDFAYATERARRATLVLARTGWASRDTPLEALEALEAAVRALGPRVRAQANLIALQATRWRGASFFSFSRSGWMKDALTAVVDALEQEGRATSLGPWLERARQSIDSMDPDTGIASQPAAAQDALRSVADLLEARAEVPHG
jgi:hypothetical protein